MTKKAFKPGMMVEFKIKTPYAVKSAMSCLDSKLAEQICLGTHKVVSSSLDVFDVELVRLEGIQSSTFEASFLQLAAQVPPEFKDDQQVEPKTAARKVRTRKRPAKEILEEHGYVVSLTRLWGSPGDDINMTCVLLDKQFNPPLFEDLLNNAKDVLEDEGFLYLPNSVGSLIRDGNIYVTCPAGTLVKLDSQYLGVLSEKVGKVLSIVAGTLSLASQGNVQLALTNANSTCHTTVTLTADTTEVLFDNLATLYKLAKK